MDVFVLWHEINATSTASSGLLDFHTFLAIVRILKFENFKGRKKKKKKWFFASMCERSLRCGDGALQVFAPVEQIVDNWARVFANWGHNESNEINREHKKKVKRKRGARRGVGNVTCSPSKKRWKKTFAGNQKVMSQGYEPRSPGGTNHFPNKAKERLLSTV